MSSGPEASPVRSTVFFPAFRALTTSLAAFRVGTRLNTLSFSKLRKRVPAVANKKVWESLDENTQALLQQCASDACEWGRDRLEAEEDELIQGFQDAGMQVDILTEEQLQAFKDAVSDVTAELKAQYGEAACAAFGIE